MNELSDKNWSAVREQPPWQLHGSGRLQRYAGCRTYFTKQAISEFIQGGVASTLMERQYKSADDLVVEGRKDRKYIVRRLTPTECARLQGFPDWWTDGADGSDSAKYKLWGNGIALPCAEDVLGRIAKELNRNADQHG